MAIKMNIKIFQTSKKGLQFLDYKHFENLKKLSTPLYKFEVDFRVNDLDFGYQLVFDDYMEFDKMLPDNKLLDLIHRSINIKMPEYFNGRDIFLSDVIVLNDKHYFVGRSKYIRVNNCELSMFNN